MTDQPYRSAMGGRIDRGKPLGFTFNGRSYTGYAGDTLASALLANGVHLVARSFKYHRPRGIMTAGVEEPNAMVQLGTGATTIPNVKATEVELFEGLRAGSVNCWPSVAFDIQSINNALSRFFPAGFYYKTMFGSQMLWTTVFERYIRQASGWGKAPKDADPDIYDHTHVHCDVLVIGGGPTGLTAALAAGRAGARVILADEQAELGGSLLSLNRQLDDKSSATWISEYVDALSQMDEVRLLPRTTIFGYYDQNYLVALERRLDHRPSGSSQAHPRQRVHHIRAKHVVLATGAHERPLVFSDNDRPGIMLAGGAQTYANRYGVLPGKQVVLFTNNDGAYEAALDLQKSGVEIAAIVDVRPASSGIMPNRAQDAGIDILWCHAVTATRGAKRIKSVQIMRFDGTNVSGPVREISCDLLLMSGGWSPVVHLFCQAQGKLRYDEERNCFVPDQCPQQVIAAGSAAGRFSLTGCLEDGRSAGAKAAGASEFPLSESQQLPAVTEVATGTPQPVWHIPSRQPAGHDKAKHFVDFQNDTTVADIRLAVREGFESVEHMKRYTLSGFGTDQGKTGNINALAVLSEILMQSIPETGTTTFRPPYTPVTFGALAGREIDEQNEPVRVTAIHDWHVKNDAIFEDVGQWKRPWYYAKHGEDMHAAVARECLAVRKSAGMLDASTLGKIMVQGPDAAVFLNRVYTNSWTKLKVGYIRYGLMCGDDGMVFDDGTTSRLTNDGFLMTTTTGGAADVLHSLEDYLQTEWPDLKIYLTSVTEQWSTVTVTGPKAQHVIETAGTDIILNPAEFQFMTVREGTVAGLPARIFRISFTGELSYEINVPWCLGLSLWEALYSAGEMFDVTPYGTEAMHVLRAEKGFIITGQETDGTVTPQDLGMDWIIAKKKGDFLGKRSFSRVDTRRPDRKQLVGILTDDPNEVLPEGAQLVSNPKAAHPVLMLGHVTSSYWSATLGYSIALAMVKRGRERMDEPIYAPLGGKIVKARITEPLFYDKENKRKDGAG